MLETNPSPSVWDQQLLVTTSNFLNISLSINQRSNFQKFQSILVIFKCRTLVVAFCHNPISQINANLLSTGTHEIDLYSDIEKWLWLATE